MHGRTMRRAIVAATTVLVMATISAYADTVPADGDAVTAGNQTMIDLGSASPGELVTRSVSFRLTCAGMSHAAPDDVITLDLGGVTVPLGGDATATSTTIGPVPADWTAQGEGCPSPAPVVASNGPSTVTLTMPTTPGNDYQFTLGWSRAGATGLTNTSVITFQVDVIGNTAPTLHLPNDIVAEATSSAGAVVTWNATASDAEDAVPPTATCSPASGSTFDIGSTTVQCTATDSGDRSSDGSFMVTVRDTTPPTLHGTPADRSVTTTDPSGVAVTYTTPTATDAGDASPTIDCKPASGSTFAIGTTTVTCTATDATGNHASASFDVRVSLLSAVTWTAVWGEPVGSGGAAFVANPGRSVPVKVELFADRVEQTRGSAVLAVATCDGASVSSMALSWAGSRWNGNLDTSSLGGPGCYTVTASLDGHAAGTFRLDLRGADPANANTQKAKVKTKP